MALDPDERLARKAYEGDPIEGPLEPFEGKWGTTDLPIGYHPTEHYANGMRENGWLPMGSSQWREGKPVTEAEELEAALHPDGRMPSPDLESVEPMGAIGASPVAPNPAAAFDGPEFGPPTPSPATDAILAQQPPAAPGIPTEDPGKQWPPSVPREAPGMVLPGGQPGTQQPSGGVEGALGEAKSAREESDAAQLDAFKAGQEATMGPAREAAEQRKILAAESLAKEQAVKAQYDKADATAAAEFQKTQQALKDFKFRDLWESKTTVQKIGSALSTALLAIGAGMMKTPKYAIDILQKEKDDDHAKQVAHLNQLKDEDVMARTGIADVRAARTKALADITLGDAHKDKVIAAQFEESALRAKNANSAEQANAYAKKLRLDSAEKEVSAQKMIRDFQIAEEGAKAKAAEQAALANLHNTQAAAGGYNPRTGRGRGAGGGSGGGGGRGDALSVFTAAATDGKTSDADLAKMGLAAGLKPAQVATEVLRIRTSGTKENILAGKADASLTAKVNDWMTRHDVKKVEGAQHDIAGILKVMQDAPHNPHAQASAFEKSVSAARGGAATRTALEIAMQHMGGAGDTLEAKIQKFKNGEFGEQQMKNLVGAMQAQLAAQQQHGKELYDAFEDFRSTLPDHQAEQSLSERARVFSGFSGFGGKSHSDGAERKTVPVGVLEQARAEVKNNGPHKASAQALLDANGG